MAHVIFESAQGPNPSFFLFIRLLFDLGACWDLDPGFGPGLDKKQYRKKKSLTLDTLYIELDLLDPEILPFENPLSGSL